MSQDALSTAALSPVTPSWVPPYGWPGAPDGWAPSKGWQPPATLLLPPGHAWWTANAAIEMEEVVRLVASALYLEADPYWWDESLETREMPTVWTAPPTWPPAPDGFEPPIGWAAPAAWGPSPTGWVFLQPDPAVYRPWRAGRDEIVEHCAAMLKTSAGLLGVLNYLERRLAYAVAVRARLGPAALRTSAGIEDAFTAVFHAQLDQHSGSVATTAGDLRDYVLSCLRAGRGPDDGRYWQLRRALASAARLLDRDFNMAIGAILGQGEDEDNVRAVGVARDLDAFIAQHRAGFTPSRESDRDVSVNHGVSAPAWELAEELATHWLRENGYLDARRTPVGADGGFDVEARGLVAQVKHRAKPTGREEIQRLVGANLHGARMAFFSTGGYTTQAVQYAQAAGVAMYLLDVSTGIVQIHS